MRPDYYTVEAMIAMIDGPNREACIHLLEDNRKIFQVAYGSTHNHQSWPGGYLDHVQEAMNIAIVLFKQLNSIRPLKFTLSDLLLVVYLHDVEKPWKYETAVDGTRVHKSEMQTKAAHQCSRMKIIEKYGICLNEDQLNGVEYAEGELVGYSNQQRAMGPLACVAHMCDVASARLWFDHPLQENDPWTGSKRNGV